MKNSVSLFILITLAGLVARQVVQCRSDTVLPLINGKALIANELVIEVNGVPLGAIDYPSDLREDGGTTTQW